MTAPPDVLGVLVAMIADALAARIGHATADTFDSLHLPPNVTRRRFAEILRSGRVVGAHREGAVWSCTREAWTLARRRTRLACEPGPAANGTRERVDDLLRRNGLRVAK